MNLEAYIVESGKALDELVVIWDSSNETCNTHGDYVDIDIDRKLGLDFMAHVSELQVIEEEDTNPTVVRVGFEEVSVW